LRTTANYLFSCFLDYTKYPLRAEKAYELKKF